MNDPKSKAKRNPPTNFLEALRELGTDIATEAKIQVKNVVSTDIPESFGVSHSSGVLQPHESVSMNEKTANSDTKTDTHLAQRLYQLREEEQVRVTKNQAEIKEQIKQIQVEIKNLAKSAGEFAAEVEIATMQATVNPGKYHQHFFARLKNTIAMLRKKVTDSQAWLTEHNQRSQKRSYYWSQVKKSGTSFMLSSERYMVTSTG